MKSVIIYGPPKCGKTRNRVRLARRFGLTKIIDGWDEHTSKVPLSKLLEGHLVLTNCRPSWASEKNRRVMSFEHAMKLAKNPLRKL